MKDTRLPSKDDLPIWFGETELHEKYPHLIGLIPKIMQAIRSIVRDPLSVPRIDRNYYGEVSECSDEPIVWVWAKNQRGRRKSRRKLEEWEDPTDQEIISQSGPTEAISLAEDYLHACPQCQVVIIFSPIVPSKKIRAQCDPRIVWVFHYPLDGPDDNESRDEQ